MYLQPIVNPIKIDRKNIYIPDQTKIKMAYLLTEYLCNINLDNVCGADYD